MSETPKRTVINSEAIKLPERFKPIIKEPVPKQNVSVPQFGRETIEQINPSTQVPQVPHVDTNAPPSANQIQNTPSESGEELIINIPEVLDFNNCSLGISSVYMGKMTYYSTTLDIVTIYLKGQKLLYIEAKTYCEMCLYFLMLPAIFISASCTVLSMALKTYNYGSFW